MATITARKLSNKTRYQATVRRGGGPAKARTFDSEAEAKAWAAALEAERPRTINELIDTYIAQVEPSESVKSSLKFWRAQLGHLDVTAVTRKHVTDALDALADRATVRKPATINRNHAALNSVLNYALPRDQSTRKRVCRLGWITENVATFPGLPENNREIRWLTDREIDRLRVACLASPWPLLWDFVCLAMHTGGRRSEITQLRWDRVTWFPNHAEAHLTRTKNGKPRVLFVTGEAFQLLSARRQDDGWLYPSAADPAKPTTTVWHHWRKAVKTAGLWAPGTDQHVKMHHLRHHTASKLTQKGASLQVVAEVLGHSSVQMAARYSHLAPKQGLGALREAFE